MLLEGFEVLSLYLAPFLSSEAFYRALAIETVALLVLSLTTVTDNLGILPVVTRLKFVPSMADHGAHQANDKVLIVLGLVAFSTLEERLLELLLQTDAIGASNFEGVLQCGLRIE